MLKAGETEFERARAEALGWAADWAGELERLHGRIGGRFARSEHRRRSLAYLQGLLSPVERKNGWQLAQQIGEKQPDGVQRLLNAADWDADAVRDDLRAYIEENLGSDEAVLVLDETNFLKKGVKSVGVQRQCRVPISANSGTADRIGNCQIGVFLCYVAPGGTTLLDRALYLPEEWAADQKRRKEAGVPESVEFSSKPALAQEMVKRVLDAGMPCRYVTGDSVYGSDRHLRLFLEERNVAFVLAVTSEELLRGGSGDYGGPAQMAGNLAADAWQRISVGGGAAGQPRLYDWAWVPLWRQQTTAEERTHGHWLLVRRGLDAPDTPGESAGLTFYVGFALREGTTLESLAQVAGTRWNMESCFESAKAECGLDQYEVRKWNAWHRHVTLAMMAQAFLVVTRLPSRSLSHEDERESQRGELPSEQPRGVVHLSGEVSQDRLHQVINDRQIPGD